MTIRTLRVTPEAILDLLKSISQGQEFMLAGEPIPAEAALGATSYDYATRTFTLEVVARFGRDTDIPPEIGFAYSVRMGPDLSAPRALAASTESGDIGERTT